MFSASRWVLLGLLIAARCAQGQAFPEFHVKAEVLSDNSNPFGDTSSAELCLTKTPQICYKLPSSYNLDPITEKFTSSSGEELVLFLAHTFGGSGSAYEYALLRSHAGGLTNLLPDVVTSNISDHALWQMPNISTMPVFLTSDYIWEDSYHYGDHRHEIRVYIYNDRVAHYEQVLHYATRRRYRSADLTEDDRVKVLNAERRTIESKIHAYVTSRRKR